MQSVPITTNVVSSNPTQARCTQWFSPGTPVSSTNKTGHHYLTEILLKVVWSTITLTKKKEYLISKKEKKDIILKKASKQALK